MAEIRQIAIDGKRIKEAVEAVETKTVYTAGDNVSITDGVISATDTTYTAGDNVTITDGVISATDTTYTAGDNVTINDGVISATGETPRYLHQIHFTKVVSTDMCTITIMGITKDAAPYSNIREFNTALNIQVTKEYEWLNGYFRNGSVSPALVSTVLSYKKFANNAGEITATFVNAETGSATVRTMSIPATNTVTDVVVPI